MHCTYISVNYQKVSVDDDTVSPLHKPASPALKPAVLPLQPCYYVISLSYCMPECVQCDLPCAPGTRVIPPERLRAQRSNPLRSPDGCLRLFESLDLNALTLAVSTVSWSSLFDRFIAVLKKKNSTEFAQITTFYAFAAERRRRH